MRTLSGVKVFDVRSGYAGDNSVSKYRNPIDVAEMVSYCDSHSHIEIKDRNGNARRVRVNGKVRTWKRNAGRIEVPCKYGLYEYFTLTERDITDVLIPVTEL